MANNKTLKALSQILGLSQGYLKGIVGGKGKSDAELFTSNAANICRAMASFIGYKSETTLEKGIRSNIQHLYTPAEVLAERIEKLLPKYGKVKQGILKEAISELLSGNLSGYNKAIRKNKELQNYIRKTAKTVDAKLIDRFRASKNPNRAAAKTILISVSKGKKIITTQAAITKEVNKRKKRWGAVGALFWQAAKQLHPKIRPNKIGRHKTKKHKLTRGAGFIADFTHNASKGEISVSIKHDATDNDKMMSKALPTMQRNIKFWMKKLQNEMLGKKYLGKYLNKLK